MEQLKVLVTGGSGFIAGHCILQLLAAGHQVRATLRSLAREPETRRALQDAGMARGDRLQFVAADLMRDDGWARAVSGVDVVLHVASPVRPGHVADPGDLIGPARDGALRVLRAAHGGGVRRVVLTSAFHAVSWGHPHDGHVFTEADWTNVDGPGVDAYGKSKTLAEQAAWDFIAAEGRSLELTTMLPVAVMGSVLGRDISGSNHVIQRMLNGAMPGLPNLYIPIVDVRDVASAHICAMTHPAAAGERFLLSNGEPLSLGAIASILRCDLGAAAGKVPTRRVPDAVVRIMGLFNVEARLAAHDLGYAKQSSNLKARRAFDWSPRDPREAILSAAQSMVRKGLVGG